MNKFRFPPEIAIQTDAENFLSGGKTLIELDDLIKKQQVIMPLTYSVDAVDSISVTHIFDDSAQPSLDSGSLNGNPNDDMKIGDISPFAFIYDNYLMNAQNNSGGTSVDFRTRLKYGIMPNTTIRKLANKVQLTKFDLDAIRDLASAGIVDVDKVFRIGFRQPLNFSEGLDDRNKEGIQRALEPGITLGSTRTELVNFDVEKGDCAVLKTLLLQKPAQAQVGEATVSISRDDDADLIQFDPAALESSVTLLNIHIPAYNKLKVELESNTANQANYKAYAALEIKNVGLFHKARLQEFSSESFPPDIVVSDLEQDEIDKLLLRQLSRVGLGASG